MLAVDVYDVDRPWNRQPCDSPIGWLVFRSFRDMPGERSIARAILIAGYSGRVATADVVLIARDCAWLERVRAWDRHCEKVSESRIDELLGENAADRAARHLDMLQTLQAGATILARGWLKRIEQCGSVEAAAERFGEKPRDLARLIEATIQLERLIFGQATERHEVTGLDMTKLTIDELSQWKELITKASK